MALDRKQQQNAMLVIGGVAVLGLGFLVFGVLAPQPADTAFANQTDGEIDVSVVADRTSAAAPEMSWVTRSRAELDNLSKMVDDLRDTLHAERQSGRAEIAELREHYDEIIIQQAEKIAALEDRPATIVSDDPEGQRLETPASASAIGTPQAALFDNSGQEFIERRTGPTGTTDRPALSPLQQRRQLAAELDPVQAQALTAAAFGQSFTLVAQADREENIIRSARNYLPAGSYAPATVLSGADAATNVVDRENPIPVLFRITGPAVTAAVGGGNGVRVNVEGCTVQGSAIGDLSSERVRVRLLSMTCVRPNGTILESEVAGYMVGAGKAGVRGRVVSREGPMVTNAALAGALQGLASVATVDTDPDEESVQQLTQSALAAAGSGGLETAATTLSEYYVTRAEQYQPVISLNGGTSVELVFMEGVSLE